MKKLITTAAIAFSAMSALSFSVSAQDRVCVRAAQSITEAVNKNSNNVVQLVSQYVTANPKCACEIVKAAIVSSEASREMVGQIVDTAILASPDQTDQIATCAIAVAPDASNEVSQVLSKRARSTASTNYSAKGGMQDFAQPGAKSGLGDPNDTAQSNVNNLVASNVLDPGGSAVQGGVNTSIAGLGSINPLGRNPGIDGAGSGEPVDEDPITE